MQLNRKHRQKQKPKKNKKQKSKYGVQTDKSRKYYRQNRRRAVLELEILKNNHREKLWERPWVPLPRKLRFVDDLGIDSLDFFQIFIDLEETYDIHIDQQEAEEIVTIGDAVETLRRATKGKRNGK